LAPVLLQVFGEGLQPIAYESRKLNPAERNYPVHDKELLAIVHAFKVWRCYLTGADVTVRTDHKSLQFIRAQPTLNPRQIRWLDYLDLAAVRHTSASDGQTERTNQTMEQLIRTTCTDPAQWEDSLLLIEFVYNNAPSATTTQSPFFLNYGIDPTTPLSPPIENPAPRSQQFVENLRQSQQKAADAIFKANQWAKQQANRRCHDLNLAPGQLVLLDTRNLGMPLPNKLQPRFCGPFRIIRMGFCRRVAAGAALSLSSTSTTPLNRAASPI
ncbi:hypothetical protein CLOP_g2294, partial [Closterium sp. NIES-67]